MSERAGKAKEVLGWATGDREVEAEGRVEEDPAVETTDRAVEEETKQVRRDYEEISPDDAAPG